MLRSVAVGAACGMAIDPKERRMEMNIKQVSCLFIYFF